MTLPTLHGESIVLRPLLIEDAPALFVAHGDPKVHHFWSSPAHADVAQTAVYIEATLALQGAHVWAITETGGEALGRIGLFVLREGVGEIGIILRADVRGRGLASKTLALVEVYAFDTLGLHRLMADIDPENASSVRLFERAGFQREGLLRGHWKTHLGVRDTLMLGKVRADR
jgi:[ribosomal protein S5]-alanine N-acetyltransferase